MVHQVRNHPLAFGCLAAGLAVSALLIAVGAARGRREREAAARAYTLGWRNGSQAALQILSEAEDQVVTPLAPRPVAPVRRLPARTAPSAPTVGN